MVSRNNSNTTDTLSPTIDQIILDHLLFLLPTDHPGLVLISKKLTGSYNYNSWRISMVIALNAKNKMKIVNGDFEEPEVYYHKLKGLWDEFDALEALYMCICVCNYENGKENGERDQRKRQEEKQREGLLPKPATSAAFSDQNKRIAHGTLCNGLYLLPSPTAALKSHHTFSAITQPNNSSL
ncbi:cysteine-rich receptor-like protein kinase 8 [Tanacetum coccineum]